MNIPTTRAAWLNFIKEHGQEAGGVANFAKILGTYPIKIKSAIDPLVLGGFVSMTGKPGPGNGGFRYALTSIGHRFLNENRDELEELPPTTGTPKTPFDSSKKAVPGIQTFAEGKIPGSAPRPESARPVTSPEPETDVNGAQARAVAKSPPEDPFTLNPGLRDALFDELFERFGDQISVKQLIDRMKRREGGDAA